MDEHLRNDLILVAVTSVIGALAWVVRRLMTAINELTKKSDRSVQLDDFRATVSALHEKINSTQQDVAILKDWRNRV